MSITRIALSFLSLTFGLTAFAAAPGLYYTEPTLAGTPVHESTYLGYYTMCFSGNPAYAERTLWKFVLNDIEKDGPFVRYVGKGDQIIFGYTDTKCLDEGESVQECRTIRTVPRCDD